MWLKYAQREMPKVFEECGEVDEGLEVVNEGFDSLGLIKLRLGEEEVEGGGC